MTTFDLQCSNTTFPSALLNAIDKKVLDPLHTQLHELRPVLPDSMSPGVAPETGATNGVVGSQLTDANQKVDHNSPIDEEADDSPSHHENEDDTGKVNNSSTPIQKTSSSHTGLR